METRIESNYVDTRHGEVIIVPEPSVLSYTVMFPTNNRIKVLCLPKKESFNITMLGNLDLSAMIVLHKTQLR